MEDDVDLRILHHIGRYTITLRWVVQLLFFDRKSPQAALNRLEKGGYIQVAQRGLPGNFSYYQLRKKGAAVINVSENKAKPKEPKGLAQDLGALWFSCVGATNRKRLLDRELRTLFGTPKGGNIIHVAQEDNEATVFRLFIPEPDTSLERYIPTLKSQAHKACSDEKLLSWIERGTFQFAVLLPNEERKTKFAELIRANDFPDLLIHLAVAPSLRDLPNFISADKETTTS